MLKKLWQKVTGCCDRRTAARRYADKWIKEARRLKFELGRSRDNAEYLVEAAEAAVKKLAAEQEKADDLYRQHATAMEALRAENQVLGETVVPSLVAANKLLQQRWEAEVAIQVGRQVSLTQEHDGGLE